MPNPLNDLIALNYISNFRMQTECLMVYTSPCGPLLLGAYGGRIIICDWIRNGRARQTFSKLYGCLSIYKDSPKKENENLLIEASRQLDCYFKGHVRSFDLPLLNMGTDFRRRVWQALEGIPYGSTMSYAEVAHCIGRPKAVRAVANAIGANPLSILVPCHRVVGAGGSLTGYAGGIEAKKFLLDMEKSSGVIVYDL